MSEQLPPATATETGLPPEATVVAAKSPNEELAARVTAALIAADLLPPAHQEQCETLLAEGKVTHQHWTQYLEKPVEPTSAAPSHD